MTANLPAGRFLDQRGPADDRARSWPQWILVAVLVGVPLLAIFAPQLIVVFLVVAALVAGFAISPRDEITVMTLLAATTFMLPANLVIGPLGQIGVPASLMAGALLLLWVFQRCAPDRPMDRGFQPIRLLAVLIMANLLASYAAGQVRGLSPLEASGANAGMIAELGALGILLFTSDMLRSVEGVRAVLRRITYGAAVLAFVAALQFFSVIDLAMVIRLPGLSVHDSTSAFVQSRDGFNRVAGFATHPIEYGVVLSMALPLALHLALTNRRKMLPWVVVAMIAGGIPLAVSRSAVLATGMAMIVYLVAQRLRTIANLLPLAAVGLVAVQAAAPGLLGSIKSLFTGVSNDPSIQGRTDDYSAVFAIWREHPLFGLGPGTFVPKLYRVLDNEYLYELVTVGTLGLLLVLALFATGYSLARRVRRFAPDKATADMAQAIAAAIAAAAVAAFTFDAFGFIIMFTTTHLMVGCAAALWRIVVRDRGGSAPAGQVGAPRELAVQQAPA